MNKSFIALITVATLIVTSINVRAAHAADAEDIAKLLFGATVLLAIGAAVRDHEKDKNKAVNTYERPYQHGTHMPKRKSDRIALPERCERSFRLRDGSLHNGFSRKCLSESYRSARPMPESCKRTVPTRDYGRVNTYSKKCLSDRGYKVARGR